jgi:flagellar FliL protein
MSEEKKEAAASSSSSSGGGNKLVMLLTLVNTVVCLAVVGLLFVSLQKEKKSQRIEDIVADEPAGEAGGHGAPAGGHGAPAGGHGAPAGGHGAPAQKKLAGFGKMVTLEQFTVNLTTPGSTTPKYVRVNISLEVPSEEVEGELTQRMPQVRNAIIDLFNSKRPSDVVSEEGRQYLKEEIRSALNGFMVSGKVKGVFFTNFALSG